MVMLCYFVYSQYRTLYSTCCEVFRLFIYIYNSHCWPALWCNSILDCLRLVNLFYVLVFFNSSLHIFSINNNLFLGATYVGAYYTQLHIVWSQCIPLLSDTVDGGVNTPTIVSLIFERHLTISFCNTEFSLFYKQNLDSIILWHIFYHSTVSYHSFLLLPHFNRSVYFKAHLLLILHSL